MRCPLLFRATTTFLQRLLAVAVLAAWLFPMSADGQIAPTGSVRGKVLTAGVTPVKGALVELLGRSDSMRTTGTGEFVFHGVDSGPQVLRIRALGYAEKTQGIRVNGDLGWTGTIVLDRVAQALSDVNVTAPGKPPEFANITKYDDFFRRRRLGFGTFRTREDIEKKGAVDVVSVLQGIPGVNVSATSNPDGAPEVRFRMARCPGQPPNLGIYINGSRVAVFGKKSENKGSELSGAFRSDTDKKSSCEDCTRIAEVLSSVALSEILFVEFYRGPGQIPSDLDRGDSCAALVIWTR